MRSNATSLCMRCNATTSLCMAVTLPPFCACAVMLLPLCACGVTFGSGDTQHAPALTPTDSGPSPTQEGVGGQGGKHVELSWGKLLPKKDIGSTQLPYLHAMAASTHHPSFHSTSIHHSTTFPSSTHPYQQLFRQLHTPSSPGSVAVPSSSNPGATATIHLNLIGLCMEMRGWRVGE